MTNADKIRAMSDKELAHLWCYKRPCISCPHDETYRCTIFDWLQKEEDEKRIIWRNENTDITRPKTAIDQTKIPLHRNSAGVFFISVL